MIQQKHDNVAFNTVDRQGTKAKSITFCFYNLAKIPLLSDTKKELLPLPGVLKIHSLGFFVTKAGRKEGCQGNVSV